jgi:hypothetical protein
VVRVFDRSTAQILKVFHPHPRSTPDHDMEMGWTRDGITASTPSSLSAMGSLEMIHTVQVLHTPSNTLLVVSRGPKAFLIHVDGPVVQAYDTSSEVVVNNKTRNSTMDSADVRAHDSLAGHVFVAATVSHCNRVWYGVREDGACCVYDVASGELVTTITDFAKESMHRISAAAASSEKDEYQYDSHAMEISSLVSHPNKGIVGAFSADKRQKKGELVLWK